MTASLYQNRHYTEKVSCFKGRPQRYCGRPQARPYQSQNMTESQWLTLPCIMSSASIETALPRIFTTGFFSRFAFISCFLIRPFGLAKQAAGAGSLSRILKASPLNCQISNYTLKPRHSHIVDEGRGARYRLCITFSARSKYFMTSAIATQPHLSQVRMSSTIATYDICVFVQL